MKPKVLPGWYAVYREDPLVIGDETFDEKSRKVSEELLKEIEEKKKEAEALLEEAKKKLEEAREESRRILDEARSSSERIIQQAKREAEKIKQQAQDIKAEEIAKAREEAENIKEKAIVETFRMLECVSEQFSVISRRTFTSVKRDGFEAGKLQGYSEASEKLEDVRVLLLESVPSAVARAVEALKVPIEEFAESLAHALWRKLTEDEASYISTVIEKHLREIAEFGEVKIYYGDDFAPDVIEAIKNLAEEWGVELIRDPVLGKNFRIEYAYGTIEDGLDVRYSRLIEELSSRFPASRSNSNSMHEFEEPQKPSEAQKE